MGARTLARIKMGGRKTCYAQALRLWIGRMAMRLRPRRTMPFLATSSGVVHLPVYDIARNPLGIVSIKIPFNHSVCYIFTMFKEIKN